MNARRITPHRQVLSEELARMGVADASPFLQYLRYCIVRLTNVPHPESVRHAFEASGGFVMQRDQDLLLAGMENTYRALLEHSPPEESSAFITLRTQLLNLLADETSKSWHCRDREWITGRMTCVMGILNVTPDSFSDGGRYLSSEGALQRALELIEQGADVIDVGGESSRPGAEPVPVREEIRRVVPVIEKLATQTSALISVDTTKASVARAALEAGAHIVNDIRALADPEMAPLIAQTGAGVVLMHMKGTPRTMQRAPHYEDVIGEIYEYLWERISFAMGQGIRADQIAIDPGIGFGKTVEHNLEILRRLGEFRSLGRPILIGTSRKSFIGHLLDLPVEARLHGTAATVAHAILQGADVVRVHDVREMKQVATILDALR